MTGKKEHNLFNYDGIEKAVFFLDEHDGLAAKEILRVFAEQFGEAVDPRELVMGLAVLFNIMPQDFDEVFNSRCAKFLCSLSIHHINLN